MSKVKRIICYEYSGAAMPRDDRPMKMKVSSKADKSVTVTIGLWE